MEASSFNRLQVKPAIAVFMKGSSLSEFLSPRMSRPVHVLVIPKRHIASLATVGADDASMLGKMLVKANEIAVAERDRLKIAGDARADVHAVLRFEMSDIVIPVDNALGQGLSRNHGGRRVRRRLFGAAR